MENVSKTIEVCSKTITFRGSSFLPLLSSLPNNLIKTLFILFQNYGFSFLINYYTHIHPPTYICLYIPKYNLLALYNITCRYVSRVDHFISENQLVCSPVEIYISCSQHNLVAWHSFCTGLKHSGPYPIHFTMFLK